MGLVWPDLVIGAIILIAMLKGYKRGFVSELAGVVALFAALITPFWYGGFADQTLGDYLHLGPGSAHVIAMFIVGLLTYVAVIALAWFLNRFAKLPFLGIGNALAGGAIDLGPGSDWQRARAQLATVPGVGPWSIETIAMRGLGDPDAFAPGDLGVQVAARQLGLPATPAALTRRAVAWQPWRAYAVQYLWAATEHPINRWPPPHARPHPSVR